jgi:small neutral amino acid transporter SnatA (MarC family)
MKCFVSILTYKVLRIILNTKATLNKKTEKNNLKNGRKPISAIPVAFPFLGAPGANNTVTFRPF